MSRTTSHWSSLPRLQCYTPVVLNPTRTTPPPLFCLRINCKKISGLETDRTPQRSGLPGLGNNSAHVGIPAKRGDTPAPINNCKSFIIRIDCSKDIYGRDTGCGERKFWMPIYQSFCKSRFFKMNGTKPELNDLLQMIFTKAVYWTGV